ncbi:hypothetical protein [Sorangium sp. So ce854]|uniref:hypothetical protein n=1 Tax=Sorangium sp. So ce854 TaxID=3133322 RepID=UPI003F5E0B51
MLSFRFVLDGARPAERAMSPAAGAGSSCWPARPAERAMSSAAGAGSSSRPARRADVRAA